MPRDSVACLLPQCVAKNGVPGIELKIMLLEYRVKVETMMETDVCDGVRRVFVSARTVSRLWRTTSGPLWP